MDNHTALNNTEQTTAQNYTCQQVEEVVNNYSGTLIKYSIIIIFVLIASFGFIGNLFVILAVLRNKAMRTPRNYFIINLASSDLMLCCITMPFTVYAFFSKVWPFGWFLCKSVTMLQAVNIFVSTMSITAIGLDRYLVVILVPTNIRLQKVATLTCFALVWGLSIAMATPMIYFTTYDSVGDNFRDLFLSCGVDIHYCHERQNMNVYADRSYTVGCFLFQYCVPLFTLAFTYSKVLGQLKARISFRKKTNAGGQPGKMEREARRQHRANLLIVLIIVIFAIVWLPFNVKNIIDSFGGHMETSLMATVIFASCYATAMISACANPILYGILNANFRYEFAKLFQLARCCPERMNQIKLDVNNVTRIYQSAVAARHSIVDAMVRKSSKATESDVPLDIIEETMKDPKLCKLLDKKVTSDSDQDDED